MIPLSISENILLLVSGLGVVQGFLLAALLYFHPKSDRPVNKFLALYILGISLVMSGPFILHLVTWQNGYVLQPLPVIVGALLYLYVRSYKETITLRKALPSILPFIIFFILSFFWHQYMARRSGYSENIPDWAFQSPLAIGISCIPYLCLIIYYVLARRELIIYRHTIRHLFSETSKIDQQWTKWMVNGYLMLMINALLMYVLTINFPEYFLTFYLGTIAIATPYIYITTYKGITHLTIWQRETQESKAVLEERLHASEQAEREQLEKERSPRTGPCDGKIRDIVEKIVLVMEQDKLYQETELTLQHLADKLQLPSYLVSQAINEGMNKNFYDLVNGHRVEEAKRLLLDTRNRNYTILSVGFEAGFNSKTTFNTVFKKFTGLTPTVFRDQHINEAAIL